MITLPTMKLNPADKTRKETAMEKTSRTARAILDEENELRRKKTEHLRRSRLQYKR